MSVMLSAVACTAEGGPTSEPSSSLGFQDVVLTDQGREMPPSRPFQETRPELALSVPLEDGIPYAFNLGHCGLYSPVDVDGSFWDPINGVMATGQPLDLQNDTEMINATAGVIVLIGGEARFRTDTGSIVRFARHEGETEFAGCA